MAYTAKEVLTDFDDIFNSVNIIKKIESIENSGSQGKILTLNNDEKVVVFLSPIGYNSSANKRYFDARDAGAKKRMVTYLFAKENCLKYFYLGIRPELYGKDYIFSVESTEEHLQGTTGNTQSGRGEIGNQVNFQRNFNPSQKFERITTRQGINISCIHKEELATYLTIFDNRELISANSGSSIEENNILLEACDDNLDLECNKRKDLIQEIHFGAPGTGKSYSLAQIIRESYEGYKETDDNPFVFRTTVHNEYSYFDFVGNVMPDTDEDGKIKYDFKPGIFTQALATALNNQDNEDKKGKDIYLIIEEMSRGNIASIFGDIFQLLDRKDNGESEYHINNELIYNELIRQGVTGLAKDKIYLPSNFHILGTANTSDQNVNVIDTAFKRRFGFVYEQVTPKAKKVKDENGKEKDLIVDGKVVYLNSCTFKLGSQEFEWNCFYQKLNDYIVDEDNGLGLTEDKQLGQFFVKFKENDNEANFNSIRNKVIHYLWEDVQSVSMTNRKIFVPNSFSKLYELFKPESDVSVIFDSQFMKFYRGES